MKFTINRDTFLKAVSQCNIPVVNTGNAALQCCALTAEKVLKQGSPDALTLRSTNSLIAIEPMEICQVTEEGDTAVNYKWLRDAISAMPSGTLTVELTRGKTPRLVVSSGKRRSSSETLEANLVPPVPSPEKARKIAIGARELLAIVSRLEYALDDVPKEWSFRKGIYLDITDQKLTAVAIGDHLWATYAPSEVRLKCGAGPFRLLLPDYAMKYIRDLAAEDEQAMLGLHLDDNKFAWLSKLEDTHTLFCFVSPSGEYPDWRTLFSRFSWLPVCELQRLAVIESLKALISTSPVAHAYTSEMRVAESALQISRGDWFEDSVPVVMKSADTAQPTFQVNARYFRDTIDAAGSNVVLSAEANCQQVALTTDDGFLGVVSLTFPERASKT